MNIKDLVRPVGFAFAMVLALNYFFPGSTGKEEIESSFVAPKEKKNTSRLMLRLIFLIKNVPPSQQ